jgi:CRP-like cAMP-binding protein
LTTSVDTAVPRRGRPRKFAAPSRAVTLTLPEQVLETLAGIDPDLSRAVVRLAQPEIGKAPHASAELAAFGRQAVILVHPSRTLEQRTGVVLVPLPDGRALISFDEPKTIAELELQLQDILEDAALLDSDRRTFEQIFGFLRDARRSSAVALKRRNIIVLETVQKSRPRQAAGSTRKKRQRKGSA